MKVLIISLPRTGSSFILDIFSNMGFSTLFEPFEFKKDFKLEDNLCLKTMIHQIPTSENNITFYKNYIKKFDLVILLDRLDGEEHWNSYLNLAYRINNKLDTNLNWVSNSVPKSFIDVFIKNEGRNRFLKMKEDIHILSEQTGNKIVYYENLFNIDKNISYNEVSFLSNYIDVNIFLSMIDISKKFKKNNLKKNII
jgi:tRNA G10  N-methylase Trm11